MIKEMIKELLREELSGQEKAVEKPLSDNDGFIGKHCMIRTYSAGVHFGTLVEKDGKEVVLANAFRVFY